MDRIEVYRQRWPLLWWVGLAVVVGLAGGFVVGVVRGIAEASC